jgi:hypothetical protein
VLPLSLVPGEWQRHEASPENATMPVWRLT